jgi:hypothetical protein
LRFQIARNVIRREQQRISSITFIGALLTITGGKDSGREIGGAAAISLILKPNTHGQIS